jgi:MFS family permease
MLGGVLTDVLGYHPAMGIGATLTFAGAMVALLFLPETRHLRVSTPTQPVRLPARAWLAGLAKRGELFAAIALLGGNRLVMAGILLSTFGLFVQGEIGDATRIAGFTVGVATLTGLGLGAHGLISMVAAPVMGSLSDRLGNRWRVAAGGLLPGVAGFGLLAFGSLPALLFGLPLVAVCGGSNQGLSTALVGDLSGDRQRGRWLGVLFTIGDLASAVGPLLAYGLIPHLGVPGVYVFSAVVIICLLGVALHWSTRSEGIAATSGN